MTLLYAVLLFFVGVLTGCVIVFIIAQVSLRKEQTKGLMTSHEFFKQRLEQDKNIIKALNNIDSAIRGIYDKYRALTDKEW